MNRTTTLGLSGLSSPSNTVVEDIQVVATVVLPLHHQSQSTKPRTRPSRLPQKTMRLAHPSLVAHLRPSLKDLTQALTDMVPHHLPSQKDTTHTTDMALTTDELVAVAAADVEVHGVAAATLDNLLASPHSCRT